MVAEVVSKNIRQLRIEMGWSQDELARRSGLSLRVISRLETEPHNMTIKTLDSIAKALEVTHSRLFSGSIVHRNRAEIISEIRVLLEELR